MIGQRLGLAQVAVIGHHLVQYGLVARLLDVGGHAEDQPQRVVVEAGADVVVALLGQRLVLVVGGAVLHLGGGDVQNALAGQLGDDVHEAQQVLRGVAEAHAAADAALEVGRRARHMVGHGALVLVPGVEHAVHLDFRRVGLEVGQLLGKVVVDALQRGLELRLGLEGVEQLFGGRLVDDGGSLPLFLLGVLAVAQHEDEGLLLARLELYVDAVRRDGRPAGGHGVLRLAGLGHVGIAKAVVQADEALAVGVVAVDGGVDGEQRIVVAALAVLGLVVDGGADDLHLADGEVALEVGHVVVGVPQAPLDEGEEGEVLFLIGLIAELDAGDLGGVAQRHHGGLLADQTVALAGDDGVAQAVTALVLLQVGLDGHPAGRPQVAALVDVVILAAGVGGDVVVAIARQAQQAGVLVKGVAARGVGHQREEILFAEIVDPRVGGIGARDDVLAGSVIEVTVLHGVLPPAYVK